MDQPGKVANPARGQLNREKIFSCPRACLRIWFRETGSAVPSRVSLLVSILRLNLVLTYGIPPEFRVQPDERVCIPRGKRQPYRRPVHRGRPARTQRMVQLPEVHPRTVRPTERSPRAQNPDAKSRGTRDNIIGRIRTFRAPLSLALI